MSVNGDAMQLVLAEDHHSYLFTATFSKCVLCVYVSA